MPADTDTLTQLKDFLGEDQGIQDALPKSVYRPGQLQMANAVADVLAEGGANIGMPGERQNPAFLVVEAPTGSGKSMALGIPTALYLQRNPKAAFIWSTGSKSLQNQLVLKDLPTLQQLFPDISFAVLFGRDNYLSLDALSDLNPNDLTHPIAKQQFTILTREFHTLASLEYGSLDEVRKWWSTYPYTNGQSLHPELLKAIACQANEKPNAHSYYQKALVRANQASIVVMNHHLLAARGVMIDKLWPMPNPGFNLPNQTPGSVKEKVPHVLIDECHLLPETLRDTLTLNTKPDTWSSIAYLTGGEHAQKFKDMLSALSTEWQAAFATIPPEGLSTEKLLEMLPPELLAKSVKLWQEFSNATTEAQHRHLPRHKMAIDQTSNLLATISNTYAERVNKPILTGPDVRKNPSFISLKKNRQGAIHIQCTPLDIQQALTGLWGKTASVTLTSATAKFGTHQQTSQHYGLPEINKQLDLPSPFNLKQNVHALVACDIEPRDTGVPKFLEYCIPILEALQGRSLMLFTSYSALKAAQEILTPIAQKNRFRLLQQLPGEPPHLLAQHLREDPHCVLLATTSLWTGIDIPGQNLSAVLVHKLPFENPTAFTKALEDFLKERQGINYFRDVAVPETINHLKQGVGRLIRTENDTGILLVGDDRCMKAAYAPAFKTALKDFDWKLLRSPTKLPSVSDIRKHCQLDELLVR